MNPQDLDKTGNFLESNKGVVFIRRQGQYDARGCILSPDIIYLEGNPFYLVGFNKNIVDYYCIKLVTDLDKIKEYTQLLQEIQMKKRFTNLGKGRVSTMGSDPEIFVLDKQDKVIPAYTFLKGKDKPDLTGTEDEFDIFNYTHNSGKQKMFWDGFQAEFNTVGSYCLGWVQDSLAIGMASVLKKAQLKNPDAKLTLKTLVEIDTDVLANAEPQHVEFGCMPSFNAYNMKGLQADGRNVPFRSTGGHIHFGINKLSKEDAEKYVKTLDKILGVACVSLFAKQDDPRRRMMYGLAGEYRLPPHGLEYRTLSNAWMAHPVIFNLVFELARKCIAIVDKGDEVFYDATEEETIRCINECDVDLAREILARNKDNLIKIFNNITFDNTKKSTNLYKIFMLGMESIVQTPDDIMNNWSIGKEFGGKYEGHGEAKGQQIRSIEHLPLYSSLKDEQVTEIYEELVANIKSIDEDVETATLQAI